MLGDEAHTSSGAASDVALRVKSHRILLVEKGLVDPPRSMRVDTYEHKLAPHGARVVHGPGSIRRTKRPFADAGALRELAMAARRANTLVVAKYAAPAQFVVLHAVLLYPWPCWSASGLLQVRAYRSRAVIDRAACARVRVAVAMMSGRVWDSTAELRYRSVLPERPPRQRTNDESNWPRWQRHAMIDRIRQPAENSYTGGHDMGGDQGWGPIE